MLTNVFKKVLQIRVGASCYAFYVFSLLTSATSSVKFIGIVWVGMKIRSGLCFAVIVTPRIVTNFVLLASRIILLSRLFDICKFSHFLQIFLPSLNAESLCGFFSKQPGSMQVFFQVFPLINRACNKFGPAHCGTLSRRRPRGGPI